MSIDYSPGQFVTSADGTKIWCHAAGDPTKPPVVFVHGFAFTADIWEKQYLNEDFLSKVYVIRYDVRGCGRSEGPLYKEAYECERNGEDIKAVCDAYGVEKPFIAGWSIGAVAPADYMAVYGPDSVQGIIILGGFPYRSMRDVSVHPYILSIIPGLLSDDPAEFADILPKFATSAVAPGFKLPYETVCRWIGGTATRPPCVRQWMMARDQDETNLLKVKDTIPIMVVHGREDRNAYEAKLEAFMRKTFAKVEWNLLLGVGHSPFYEAPEATNEFIVNFVQKHSATA